MCFTNMEQTQGLCIQLKTPMGTTMHIGRHKLIKYSNTNMNIYVIINEYILMNILLYICICHKY